jgi:hypothetical protein
MRDFRDAKAMAQTLREALTVKSVALTQAESLELVAKSFGLHDWNVLAARIAAERQPRTAEPVASVPADRADASGGRREIVLPAKVLDGYVGVYQLNDSSIFTIIRDGNQLTSRITGQRSVPLYAESETTFFAKIVNAQISLVVDARGQAESLILHQNGRNIPMPRIDAATAQEINDRIAAKLTSRSASPGTEAALRRLVDGLVSGKPNYDDMGADLAQATREQLPDLLRDVGQLGAVLAIEFLGVGSRGEDVYRVRQEGGETHWRIALDSGAKISMAWVSPGL